MRTILTSKGEPIYVDDADYEWLAVFAWHLDQKGYAKTGIRCSDCKSGHSSLKMHRMIMGLERGDLREIDHRDGNPANNQRYNLRICNSGQNQKNKGRVSFNSSGYKGVSWYPARGKWHARIKVDGKCIHLGLFESAEDAHKAYCAAADKYHGEFANHGEVLAQR